MFERSALRWMMWFRRVFHRTERLFGLTSEENCNALEKTTEMCAG